MTDKYDTTGNPESEYQAGSNDLVLTNKLDITDLQEMENTEFDHLVEFQANLFKELSIDQKLTTTDLCKWHQRWLGDVYVWAGNYRTVTMSKDGFPFAAVPQLSSLMVNFEQQYLQKYTPSNKLNRDELEEAMAICHVEFIVIHPFREGNGRLGRLLTTVMSLQAGMPVLDFEPIEKEKDRYILAIHAGFAGNYEPMKLIFSDVMSYSLQQTHQNENND